MTPINQAIFTILPQHAEIDLLKLMEHIASGEPDIWAVYLGNGTTGRFDNFEEANRFYEEAPKNFDSSLVLYTRIGTSVTFCFREASE